MKFVVMVILSLLAFAGNSVLNRWAMQDGLTDPASFAVLRLCAGAVFLWILVSLRYAVRPQVQVGGVLSLLFYAVGFSFAYVTLDAGAGALILFGVVQITLFLWAVLRGEGVPKAHYIGAACAFVGLAILCWPQGQQAMSVSGIILMIIAGAAWGIYTALGRGAGNPTVLTANNFLGAAILSLPILLLFDLRITGFGAMLAILSGTVTSGMGYAIWYSVLPSLRSSLAAILQLSVPIIAAAVGILFLGEILTMPFIIAAVLVIGGTVIALQG